MTGFPVLAVIVGSVAVAAIVFGVVLWAAAA